DGVLAVTGQGMGGVAEHDVDLTGLDGAETDSAAERHELDRGGVTEEGSRHGTAVVGVEPGVRTRALVEEPEPGVHGIDTADETTTVHHRVETALGACHGSESQH